MTRSKALLFFILVGSIGYAAPAPVIDVSDSGPNPVRTASSLWHWERNSEGALVLYLLAKIRFPTEISRIQNTSTLIQPVFSKDLLQVRLSSLQETVEVELADHTKHSLVLRPRLAKTEVVEKDCAQWNLVSNIDKAASKAIYIGVACEKIDGNLAVSITQPKDSQWVSSNLFETAGKGERWKLFSVPQLLAPTQKPTTLHFIVSMGGENASFTVGQKELLALKKPAPPPPGLRAVLGLGPWNLSIEAPFGRPSGVRPGLYASLEAPLSVFVFGLILKYAVPLPSTPSTTINYYSGDASVGVPITIGRFSIVPQLFIQTLGVSYNLDSISYSYSYNGFGFGVSLIQRFLNQSEAFVRLAENGYLPSQEGRNWYLTLGYFFSPGPKLQWGIVGLAQNQSYSLADGTRSLMQYSLNTVVRF